MATLPDIVGQQEPVPQAGGVASYEPPNWRQVGMAGQFISGAGHNLEEAAATIAATNERQDNLVAQSAANTLSQVSVKQQFDPKDGWANAKEGQAVGKQFVDDNTARFKTAAASIRDSLQTENQKKIFDQHSQAQELKFTSALLSHQANETDKFNSSTENATINNQLSSMARDPQNELNFQSGLAAINGTIDQSVKRRGLPPEQATELKSKYLEAAYTTRILSIKDGIPGLMPANPYAAEAMFKQVQDKLGPQAQVHLANQVQKSVQSVQARDTAQSLIFGRPATEPLTIAPVATGKPLEAVVQEIESNNNPNAVGPMTRTGERAQGAMQVMPATSANPGYGVRPAADNSPEELARVGRDYLGAMTARYNDPALVLAAYNAGPGKVDQWIQKYGDPRSGTIGIGDWVAKIPFAETQAYVVKGLKKLNAQAGQPDAPIAAPTANNLKTDLYARADFARKLAEQQYPGDTAYADSVVSRVLNYGNMVLANQKAGEQGAHDQLIAGMVGSKPDGSDAPTTIDQLLADPAQKANWDKATPEVKDAIQQRFANNKKGQKLDGDSTTLYYGLLGKAGTDPEAFVGEDLAQYYGKMPDHLLLGLMQSQKAINAKDVATQAKGENFTKARSVVEDMLKAAGGLGMKAPPNSQKAKDTEQFYGRLNEAMQDFKDQNGKWPQQQDIRKIAGTLLLQGKESGGTLWDSSKPAFQAEPGKFYIPVPSDQAPALTQSFFKVYGRAPSKTELQKAYTKYKLAGGK